MHALDVCKIILYFIWGGGGGDNPYKHLHLYINFTKYINIFVLKIATHFKSKMNVKQLINTDKCQEETAH